MRGEGGGFQVSWTKSIHFFFTSLMSDFDKTISQMSMDYPGIYFLINYSNKLPSHVKGPEGPPKPSTGARSRGP